MEAGAGSAAGEGGGSVCGGCWRADSGAVVVWRLGVEGPGSMVAPKDDRADTGALITSENNAGSVAGASRLRPELGPR